MTTHKKLESGAAMMTALVIAFATSLFVGAAVMRGLGSNSLAWRQSRSESALLLAEGGANDELSYIAANTGSASVTSLSSQPVVYAGTTQKYPGESHDVYGREGVIAGNNGNYWVCSSNNEWWHSGATPVAWDGVTSPFYITASSYVNGNWRRVEVQASPLSAFSQAGQIGLGNYNDGSSAVTVNSGSTVAVSGTSITNGPVSNGGTCKSTHCQNADTSGCSSTQFTTSNCNSGSSSDLFTKPTPYTYPTCTSQCQNVNGCSISNMSSSSNNNNGNGCYTYKSTAGSATLSPSTCTSVSCPTTLSSSCWGSCNGHPGTTGNVTGTSCSSTKVNGSTYSCTMTCATNHPFTSGQSVTISGCTGSCTGCNGSKTITSCTSNTITFNCSSNCNSSNQNCSCTDTVNHVKTLIFEPGDYYFTSCNLPYSPTTECVIDDQALATGGTPGQVRFWINDNTSWFAHLFGQQNQDLCQLPISRTCSGCTTPVSCVGTPTYTPNCSNFRIYYNGDASCLTMQRPSTWTNTSGSTVPCCDYNGNTITGDFNHYCGIYSCTKQTGDTSSTYGSNVCCSGCSSGACTINGACLADHIQYSGNCNINFVTSNNPNDPGAGTGVTGGYSCSGE